MNRLKRFLKLWMLNGVTAAVVCSSLVFGFIAFCVYFITDVKSYMAFLAIIFLGFLLLGVAVEAVDSWKNSKETK